MLKKRVKATNLELTEAISNYIDNKFDALNKFISEAEEVLAEIEVGKTSNHHHKGDIFRAEINVSLGGKLHRAVVETADLYSAIDQIKDKIVYDFEKTKRKKIHLLKRGHQKIKNMIKGVFGREKN